MGERGSLDSFRLGNVRRMRKNGISDERFGKDVTDLTQAHRPTRGCDATQGHIFPQFLPVEPHSSVDCTVSFESPLEDHDGCGVVVSIFNL